MNYRKIRSKSFFNSCYLYLDTENHMAVRLFKEMRIHIRPTKVYGNDNNGLRLVMCKVRKNDETKFLEAMEQLKNKALLIGTKDYLENCDMLQVL